MATDLDSPTTENDAPDSAAQSAEGAASQGMLQATRAWLAAHRAVSAGMLIGGVIATGVVVTIGVRMYIASTAPKATYDDAYAAFEAGAYKAAREKAETMMAMDPPPPGPPGGPPFVLGASICAQTDAGWTVDAAHHYDLAAGYLQHAREVGFPPDKEGEGLFLLGKCLYLSEHPVQARAVLLESLPEAPERADEIHWYLAESYIHEPKPNFEMALEENTAYLASKSLSPRRRANGEVQRAEILLHLGRLDESRDTLAALSSPDIDSSKKELIRGLFFMKEGDRLKQAAITREETLQRETLAASNASAASNDQPADEPKPETPNASTNESAASTSASTEQPATPPDPLLTKSPDELRERALVSYERAIAAFTEAARLDAQLTAVSRTSQFLVGRCMQEMGDFELARQHFDEVTELFPGSAEAMASRFLSGEIARGFGENELAISQYRRAITGLTSTTNYINPWLTIDDIRDRLITAYTRYMDTHEFQFALDLIDAAGPIFTRVERAQWKGDALAAWARDNIEEIARVTPAEAPALRRKARELYRRAGEAFTELARSQWSSRAYTDDVWTAAEAFRLGGDHEATVEMLKWYLRYDSQRRQPKALLYMGEALLHLARYDQALTVLHECIEFHPTDPVAYEARLVAARAFIEKGERAHAERLLQENLNGRLAPSSPEWRNSLFELGRLLMREERYEDAVRSFEKYIHFADQYDDRGPHRAEAQYLLGRCYLDLIRKKREEFGGSAAPSVQSQRAQDEQKMRGLALEQFRAARMLLKERQETADLPPHEAAILKNSYIAIGSTLLDLRQYEEAIEEYSAAAARYPNSPETLDVRMDIARAYRELGETEKARGSIQQAQRLLDLLRESGEFQGTPDYTADEWADLLQWQARL